MGRANSIAALALGCLIVAVLTPSLSAVLSSQLVTNTNAPLDPSLRVPVTSIFLATENLTLHPWDRVRGLENHTRPLTVSLDSRAGLMRELQKVKVGESLSLDIVGPDGSWQAPLVVSRQAAWELVLAQWSLLLASGIYLLLGFLAMSVDRHPAAAPVAGVSLCIGIGLIGTMNLALPAEPSWEGGFHLQARSAHLAWSILPATLLHLAMRFPVVIPRFRQRSMVTLAYSFWILLALLAQARFHNASILNGLEKITFASSGLAAGALVIAGLARRRTLAPIETARARALALGFCIAGTGPLVILASGTTALPHVSQLLTLLLTALPLALGWSIIRYNLLDLPYWIRHSMMAGGVCILAFLISTGVFTAGAAFLDYPLADESPLLISFALATIGIYHFCRIAIRWFAGRNIPLRARSDEIIALFSSRVMESTSAADVMRVMARVIREELKATNVAICAVDAGGPPLHTPLEKAGLALWRENGSPTRAISVLSERLEDPGADCAELVLAVLPVVGPQQLVIVSAREDGLPYTAGALSTFERMIEISVVSLAAAATSRELELEVSERTLSIERSLGDRTALLGAAQRVLEATDSDDVRGSMESFLISLGSTEARWEEFEPLQESGRLNGRLDLESSSDCYLVSSPFDAIREKELNPIFETMCAFANLSLGRLYTLLELRDEVGRQSKEIARITAESYRDEFVRSIAHELRKPAEEAESLGLKLARGTDSDLREHAIRIVGISAEFQRRLDALLCQSDFRLHFVRFDIASAVDDVVMRSATIARDRDHSTTHELIPLPIIGDPTRIGSVIENLVDNAVKATDEGGTIQVRTGLQYSEDLEDLKPLIYVEVEDDGSGISKERLDSIFEPGISFFSTGFGLGLALCGATVSAHGGSISVLSDPGRTRFRVIIPQVPADRMGEPR